MSYRAGGRRNFSLSLLFTSFFGALMVGGAYGYYNYKFSKFNFIDFNDFALYSQEDRFMPTHEKYGVVIYSSRMGNFEKIKSRLDDEFPIIAIDMHLAKRGQEENITFLTAGTNTMLRIVHRFAVREVPCFFLIEKQNDRGLYKQASQIHIF